MARKYTKCTYVLYIIINITLKNKKQLIIINQYKPFLQFQWVYMIESW